MRLMHEAGFVAEMFDVKKLLEVDQDQVTYARRSLCEKLISLAGIVKTED